jgi:drug/metabolite transporter (DMT)-like permease
MPDKPKAYTYPVLVLAMIFWSLSFIWVKIVFKYLSPTATIFVRLIIASVFFIVFTLILGKLQKIQKSDIYKFLLLAFFEPFLYYLGESYGISYVSPTVAAIIISTIPLFLPFAMFLIVREKIARESYIGVLVSFTGVLLVVLNNDLSFSASPRGIMFLMLAVFSVMGYSYLLQDLAGRYNAFTIIAVQNFFGIFYFLPLFLLFDLADIINVNWNSELILSLCALAVFASSLAFFLYTMGVQQIGVTKSTVFTYIIPVLTAVFSFIFLKEAFTIRKIFGILLVIGGLFISQINLRALFIKKKN